MVGPMSVTWCGLYLCCLAMAGYPVVAGLARGRSRWETLGLCASMGPGLIAICVLNAGVSGCANNVTRSAQPSQGRDTPVGAMNAFRTAVLNGDIATVADSYDTPKDESCRMAYAQAQIANDQLLRAVESRLGHDAGVRFGLWSQRSGTVEPLRRYTADDFRSLASNPNLAEGRIGPNGAWQPLRRGPDGIWRIALGEEQTRPEDVLHMTDLHQKRAALYQELTNELNTGRIRNLYKIIDAIDSQDRAVSMAWGLNQLARDGPALSPDGAKFDATSFDKSTVRGAIGAYFRAFTEHDRKAIAEFFYSAGDPDGKLVAANTERILTVLRLKDAINQKFGNRGESFVSDDVGLVTPADLAWWCDVEQQESDRAIGFFEDNSRVSFRRIHGVWKLDITPASPQTPVEVGNDMEHDSKILDQTTADVLAGKYKELSNVRDALISADVVRKQTGK
jgi:hypothetical protein